MHALEFHVGGMAHGAFSFRAGCLIEYSVAPAATFVYSVHAVVLLCDALIDFCGRLQIRCAHEIVYCPWTPDRLLPVDSVFCPWT